MKSLLAGLLLAVAAPAAAVVRRAAPAPAPAPRASAPAPFPEALKTRLESITAARLPEIRAAYERLHRNPELSEQERESAALLAADLGGLGYEVTTGVGGHGVVAVLRYGDGPTVLVRADMDALPVQEETGLPYASEKPGVMHACGHDLHMAVLLGTARALLETRDAWKGTIVLIGQPAEELGKGAEAMIKDGLFERFPKPDYALALHDSDQLLEGRIGFRAGPIYSAADGFRVKFWGKGGHGSRPDLAMNPIPVKAQYILDMLRATTEEVDPRQAAIWTVGKEQAGTKNNVIPETAELEGTIRTYDPEVRAYLVKRTREAAEAIAAARGFPRKPEVHIHEIAPPVVNDPGVVERAIGAMRAVLGADRVGEIPPIMASEDFAHIASRVPSMIYFLGAQKTLGPDAPRTHSSKWAPDFEPTATAGVIAMAAAVLVLLGINAPAAVRRPRRARAPRR